MQNKQNARLPQRCNYIMVSQFNRDTKLGQKKVPSEIWPFCWDKVPTAWRVFIITIAQRQAVPGNTITATKERKYIQNNRNLGDKSKCNNFIQLVFRLQCLLSHHFISHKYYWTVRTALILYANDSRRFRKHLSKILVLIDTIALHSCSVFAPKVFYGSGNCGGYFSTVNSSSCSQKQFELIWV